MALRVLTSEERGGINVVLRLAARDEWVTYVTRETCCRCGGPLLVWFQGQTRWTKDPFCILCHDHKIAHQLYLLARRLLAQRLRPTSLDG